MLNTLYTIAGGIALTIGAIGASDDFDGAQLAQNAFFGPEDESELIDNQNAATEDVQVVKDIDEWNELAAQVMSMSLTSKDDLTDDEKLEIAVLTEEMPTDAAENLEENFLPEGLSEEEFFSLLDRQYNDAMTHLATEEIADSEPVVIESVNSDENLEEELANVELQPEDDLNAEKALEVVQSEQEIQVEDITEKVFQDEPWVVVHGLPDIPDEDMNVLMGQKSNQQAENEELTEHKEIENVTVNEIPVMESIDVDLPEVEAPEIEDIEAPLFDEAENIEENVEEAEEAEAEEVEAEEVEAEEVEAEEVEAEEVEAEEVEAEEVEAEAETEDAVEEVESEAEELGIVEPLEFDEEETLVIPSTEIPPAVVSEEEKAKIREEVDALIEQSENYDSWIPRQIPVAGQVDDSQPEIKPEDSFIQNFSKQNAKESILENNGIDLNN